MDDVRTRPFQIETRYRIAGPAAQAGPDGAAQPTLLLLHGQGMTGDNYHRLLGLPPSDRTVIVPDGPYPFEKRRAGKIDVGYGWYLYTGDQDDFRRHLEHTEAHLLGLLQEVRRAAPVDPARTVVVGYSQGGYLAGFLALRNRTQFAGLVLISTRFKHEFLAAELAAKTPPPTLIIHSESDPATSWPTAKASIDHLERAGGDVTVHLHEEGHRIPANTGAVIADWLAARGM